MVRVKASLILLFLIVPIVRSSQASTKNVCIFQAQANLSMAELEALDANTKYWLRTQNAVRTKGSPCSEDKCVEACPEGWEANGAHCYLWGDEKKNWTAAEDFCRGEGGHLATVNTNATKEFVLEGLASKNPSSSWVRVWIGGSDIEEKGVWKWTDCTPWEDMFWAPGQPDNYNNNQDCLTQVLLSSFNNGALNRMWDDYYCSREIEFLCSTKICSSDNSKEEETTLAENTNNSNNEEGTSGASVMWKLISSSFPVLLFLFF